MRANDGAIIFSEHLPKLQGGGRKRAAYASLVYANHFFYAVTRFSGTYVFKAQPKFELVAQNQFSNDQSQFNGTPAISDDQLYLRSDKYL
ncbi:serine/threonine protein kinase, partial [bacterium]|nr:serine/threonine protein kinase [bacterium]